MVSCSAWARGFYFHVFPDGDAGTELVAETTRVKRCPRELLEAQGAEVAACGLADGGHLIALKEGSGVRFKLVGKQGARWHRFFEGTVVFQEALFVVLESSTNHRALWLSPVDGSTTRSVDFVEQPGPAPLKGCDDHVMKWFRSATGTIAAICRALD